jgi:hypothetical protein
MAQFIILEVRDAVRAGGEKDKRKRCGERVELAKYSTVSSFHTAQRR